MLYSTFKLQHQDGKMLLKPFQNFEKICIHFQFFSILSWNSNNLSVTSFAVSVQTLVVFILILYSIAIVTEH